MYPGLKSGVIQFIYSSKDVRIDRPLGQGDKTLSRQGFSLDHFDRALDYEFTSRASTNHSKGMSPMFLAAC
jgi:hypothetical protein